MEGEGEVERETTTGAAGAAAVVRAAAVEVVTGCLHTSDK